jgi:hypothetical protein
MIELLGIIYLKRNSYSEAMSLCLSWLNFWILFLGFWQKASSQRLMNFNGTVWIWEVLST